MWKITIADTLLILVTFLGPIFAVQTQKWIENSKEEKNRKLWIFHTLMATRANRASDKHVEALNMIQMEYNNCKSGKGKEIIDAWKEYHEVLNDAAFFKANSQGWELKRDELFISLLFEMSRLLKYNYNKVDIQKGCYSPEAHIEREAIQAIISRGLADVFQGKKSFPVSLKENNSITD